MFIFFPVSVPTVGIFLGLVLLFCHPILFVSLIPVALAIFAAFIALRSIWKVTKFFSADERRSRAEERIELPMETRKDWERRQARA